MSYSLIYCYDRSDYFLKPYEECRGADCIERLYDFAAEELKTAQSLLYNLRIGFKG